MSTAPLDPKCPGQRDLSNTMVGICILCGRKDEKSRSTPPAVRLENGRWACERLVQPAGWPKP